MVLLYIKKILREQFQIEAKEITRLGGYSNTNYGFVNNDGSDCIIRLARKNFSLASILSEEHILNTLASFGFSLAPEFICYRTVLPTADNPISGFIHLFLKKEGAIAGLWWQPCPRNKAEIIFTELAKMHAAMASIPYIDMAPCMAEIPSITSIALTKSIVNHYVQDNWEFFCLKARMLQTDIQNAFPWGRANNQWIHGDVQLENILFDGDRLSAFLDFEQVRWDACEKDAIFSAFRICKEGASDIPFYYDKECFELAINSYLNESSTACRAFFNHFDSLWKPFFCLDQAIVYLQNAFHGDWQLQENSGFLPCFDEVLHYGDKQ